MSPRWLLVSSLGFTLLFNIAWAWGTGWLSIVAAAVCTLIVPAALHLWPMVPAEGWFRRGLRALVMTGICVTAAITSFSHSVDVLIGAGWTELTAWAVTGGAELLVALSTMALRTDQGGQAVQVADTSPVQAAVPDRAEGADTPVRAPADRPADTPAAATRTGGGGLSVVDSERSADLRAWVAELGETPTEYAVRKRYNCRQTVAARLLAELDTDPDRVAV